MSKLKHSISTYQVNELKTRYAKSKNKILKQEFQDTAVLPTCETFDRAALDQLLSQEGCVGIRIYFGMDEDLNVNLAIVGVDENDHDIQPATSGVENLTRGDTTDVPVVGVGSGQRCPPDCPPQP